MRFVYFISLVCLSPVVACTNDKKEFDSFLGELIVIFIMLAVVAVTLYCVCLWYNSINSKSRGKDLSYQWITSYKNSFLVGYGTIRVVDRPRKIK